MEYNQNADQPAQPKVTARSPYKGCCLLGCLMIAIFPFICITAFITVYVFWRPEPIDLLIIGVDARSGEGYLTRTDSILLLNVTPADSRITLLSIPRDVFIHVPGYGEQRINTINLLAEQTAPGTGPALLEASILQSFDIQVDRYVRLDFQAFAALIDAVDGVDIEVPKLIIDYEYPTATGGVMTVRFEAGKQHMDGERALQYARTRHQDSDYHRAARQQQVVDALLKKLRSPGVLVYGVRVWNVLQMNADTNLGFGDIVRMGPGLLMGWSNREQRVLQGADLIGTQAGYWIPDYTRISPWIMSRFD